MFAFLRLSSWAHCEMRAIITQRCGLGGGIAGFLHLFNTNAAKTGDMVELVFNEFHSVWWGLVSVFCFN